MRISYDSEVVVTGSQWDAEIIGGLGKTTGDEDEELLLDYHDTFQQISVDKQGYLSFYTKYNECFDGAGMPKEMYEEAKEIMPPDHPDDKRIVERIMEAGVFTTYAEDGSVVFTYTFPADSFKVDASLIVADSMYQFLGITSKVNSKDFAEKSLSKIKNRSVRFNLLGKTEIIVENKITQNSAVKVVYNVESGLAMRSALYENNQLVQVTINKYKIVNNFYIADFITTYQMGELSNGEWGVESVETERRSAISIQIK
jgi:hypothetical protein